MPWFGDFRRWVNNQIDYIPESEEDHRPAYLDRPNDPDAYPEEERNILRSIPGLMSQLFAEEAADLSQLGLPIPTPKTTQISFEPEAKPLIQGYFHLSTVMVHLPTFNIPIHHCFPVFMNVYYTIAGSQQHIETAKADLKEHGFIYLIEHYPGVWTNRNPYDFYLALNEHGSEKAKPRGYYVSIFKDGYKFFRHAITQLPELSTEAIRTLEHRINLLQTIYQYHFPYQEDFIRYEPDIIYCNGLDNDLLFGAKLPAPTFPADRVSFKILPGSQASPGITEQWLENLRRVISAPACFELRNEPGSLYYLLTVAKQDVPSIEQHFELYFPDISLLPHEPSQSSPPFHLTALPKLPHMFIKEPREFALDPYLALFHLFDSGQHNEAFQIFFVPLQEDVLEHMFDKVSEWLDKDSVIYTPALDEIVQGLKKKTTPWLVALQLYTDNKDRLHQFKQNFLAQFETVQQKWQFSAINEPILTAYAIPHWNVVANSELASLVHFPGKEIQSERLETANMKAKLPPDSYTTGPVVIGESEARGTRKPVTLPEHVRDRHVYIVGKSGMGKSTLITNVVIANMQAGEGVCVIDPHGDLVATGAQPLLDYVPAARIRDTIYFNAADKEYPLALNMLSAKQDDELSLLADNLLVVFRRQSDGWGPRMEDILRATLQTLMHTPGSSFLDIKRLLHNEAFRQSVVRRLTHPMLKEFWEEDFPTNYNRKDASAPIISRVNKFLYLPQLYAMLSSPESKLDFYDIIQSKKILLVNLSSGTIGEDNAQLLGSLIVTQLQMAAMRRAGLPPAQRHPFYLYVDEFQNFTTASFEKILSEARKYKLCLTLAHQYISQLSETQRDAIFGNVGTMIMFSCGDRDAHALRYQLGSYEAQDLVNLTNFEALLRPESAKDTFPFRTIPPPEKPEGFAEAIIEHTRMTYATIIDPDAAPATEEQPAEEAPPPARITAKPIAALDKNFASKGDEILYYIEQAEYLNTDQIKQLCYGHLAESARAPAASRDLKKLIDAKRLKNELFGKGNIYFLNRTPKPTTHNLEVRNLLVKINRSGFEIAEVTFCPQLPSLVPDLGVSFLAEHGGLLKTFWEYDAGTEGIAELMKKVARYEFFKDEASITFVFNSRSRLEQVNRSIKENFIKFAVLEEIGTLHDPVFQYASGGPPHPFF